MVVNRKKLGALLCALAATAVAAGTAAASHSGTPGVTKKQITIGGTFPLSGPASLYASIAAAEQAYYAYVNAKGGVHGRKVKDIVIDDGYDPSQTVPAVKKLVEQDHVFAIMGSLGTAPTLATWGYLNQRKVPQVLVATGDSYWGNCVHHKCQGSAKPWTMGWQPDYTGEAKLYGRYILKVKPNAKIGVLYQNDAYGKQLVTGLKAGLGSHKGQIVDMEPCNVSDSAQVIAGHLGAMAAHGADTLLVFATPQPTIYALVTKGLIPGWKPFTIINNVSANRLFELLAAKNHASLNGIVSTGYVGSQTMTPNSKGMQLAKKIIHQYAPKGVGTLDQDFAEGDLNLIYGLGAAWTFDYALKRAGKNPTRKSLMKALRSMNTSKNPFLLPHFKIKTSAKDGFPIEQLQLMKWKGGSSGDWHFFGKVYNGLH